MDKGTKRARFEAAYEAYADNIYRVLITYIGDDALIEDILQETFLRYYDAMETTNILLEEAWLIRVAKNVASSVLRREARELKISEKVKRKFIEDNRDSVEDMILQKEATEEMGELQENIFEALEREKPEWYESIMLIYIMGIPAREVAKRMGMPENTIYSMIKRVRKWIHKYYGKEFEEILGESKKDAPYKETS